MEFSLKGKPHIELNKLLKLLSIAESGGAANQMISDGHILRNSKIETRKRCKLIIGDVIAIQDQDVTILITT
ncbi:MAG: RNA-binding protein [Flavobacteriales bacterium]|nr:RNA-binding protein [Flavobacteriales bacterium]|tara:strand:- start:1074 stop:1289 length:216 start_codon:yes stop_codon:yes gene_type:complete